ncbi:hypothetical protein [Cellvibrio sp. NN19]|uniref:hypothetical protein n=1 Tax=Cellvibrio chitinivorans TaxID=3102792 RepID=UPI002B4041F9|nr:hypothetical protein [Cellvibrio sp. NN19]
MFTPKPLALVIGALCGFAFSVAAVAADSTQTAAKTSKKTTKVNSSSVEEVIVKGTYTTRSMNGATGIDMSLRETPQTVTIMTAH